MSLLKKGGGRSPLKFDLSKGKNSPLFKKFKGFVRNFGLLNHVNSVLVALSGGPDSVCLLNLLFLLSKRAGFQLHAAHFHHGLRGAEADRDAAFSKNLCKVNDIPFFLEKGDVKELSQKRGLGIQDAARRLRYQFLKDIAGENAIDVIATGHTADDQAEELIIRFMRGASLEGLSGIKVRRDDGIIRPILFATKREILEHLSRTGIGFVTDSSNLEGKYTRNKVRQLLIPVIRKHFNPSISKSLSRTALLLQEDEEALMTLARKAYEGARQGLQKRNGGKASETLVVLSIDRLSREPSSILRRVLLLGLKDAGVSQERVVSDHILKMEHMVRDDIPSSTYRLPDGFMAVRIYHHLLISLDFVKNLKSDGTREMPLIQGPGDIDLGPALGMIKIRETDSFSFENGLSRNLSYPRPIFLGYDKNLMPLGVRFRRPGDRFFPYGFKEPVKLKDFFIRRRIPKIVRDFIPILVKDGQIAGICGIEVAHPFRVTGERALIVSWKPTGILNQIFRLLNG